MKLIYCKKCKDVRALRSKPCVCSCGKSGGWMQINPTTIYVTGEATVLAFNATSLKDAVEDCENQEHSTEFHAYVVHNTSHLVERVRR
jgi:hypothetical protein